MGAKAAGVVANYHYLDGLLDVSTRKSAASEERLVQADLSVGQVVKGKVTRIEWINPHAWIHVAAEQEDGSTVAWMVEGGTPNTLLRAGIHKNSLPIGMEIVVRGYQSKDAACSPACKANGRDLAFPDGRRVFMGSSGTGAPKDGFDPTEN